MSYSRAERTVHRCAPGVCSREFRVFTQAGRRQIFLTPASKFGRAGVKFNMMPNRERQKNGPFLPLRQNFDAASSV